MDLAADDASDEPPEKNWNTLCVTRIKFRFIRLPKRRELRASPEPIPTYCAAPALGRGARQQRHLGLPNPVSGDAADDR
jgi:hypothetical protein